MAYFYGYSFVTVAIPLILGLLFLWFGKKLWNRAGKRNEEYRQRYTGHTTLRVIRVVKHERRSMIPMNRRRKPLLEFVMLWDMKDYC